MNPWDLRSALLAKHAQHVVLIHFPIALFLTGVLFDLVASAMSDTEGPLAKRTTGNVHIPTLVDQSSAHEKATFAAYEGSDLGGAATISLVSRSGT